MKVQQAKSLYKCSRVYAQGFISLDIEKTDESRAAYTLRLDTYLTTQKKIQTFVERDTSVELRTHEERTKKTQGSFGDMGHWKVEKSLKNSQSPRAPLTFQITQSVGDVNDFFGLCSLDSHTNTHTQLNPHTEWDSFFFLSVHTIILNLHLAGVE